MKSNKLMSIIFMALGLSSTAFAREEKFEENYKVEGAVKNERQIASEKEKEADREPSSITAPAEVKAEEAPPQPWLHKSSSKD